MLMVLLLFLRFYFGRNPQEDLGASFFDNRFINDSHYEFGKMFVACIALSHPLKIIKMLLSNCVSAQIFLTLFTLNPGAASSCSAFTCHPCMYLKT